MRGKRKRAIVGLSVGAHKTALAEIHPGKAGKIIFDRIVIANTTENAVNSGRITDSGAILRIFRELLTATDNSGVKELSLAIPDEGSITRIQTLPSMSRAETHEVLMSEVENYAILAGSEPILDFQITNGMPDAVGQQMEVLSVATSRELFNSYSSTMETANLKLLSMETKPLAVLRALTIIVKQAQEFELSELKLDKSSTLVTVIVEENTSMIIISRQETVKFIHSIDFGTNRLQSDSDFGELSREIKTSVNYYHNTFPGEDRIKNIILFTDSLDMTNAHEILDGFLDLPIIQLRVPVGIKQNGEAEIHYDNLSAYAAIGAAIHTVKRDKEESINFISRISHIVSTRKRIVLLLVALFFIAFLAFGARLGFKLMADSIDSKLVSLKQRQEKAEAATAIQIPIIQDGVKALKVQNQMASAAINYIKWANSADILEEIKDIIPKDAWVTVIKWETANKASFTGYALSYDSVFKFEGALTDSPYFGFAKIIYARNTQISGRSVVQYQIDCDVRAYPKSR